MKKHIAVLLVLLAFVPLAWGQQTTSFGIASSITGSEKIYAPLFGVDQNITTAQFKAYCLAGFAPTWSSLTGTPTTLAGYGITDAGNGVLSESISAASTVTLASQGRVSFDSITLGAGSGAYVANRPLSDSGARAGDEWFINVIWPTSTNPTLSFFDSTTSGTALGSYTGTTTGGSSTLQFVFNGTSWVHLSKGEVPVRLIPAATFAAMLNALNGPSGLLALNSSGNLPSVTLDPTATLTIPAGATLVVNGTINVSKLDQKVFTTTTLEQAYVLDAGQLALAQDTGLIYVGDGATAGGHLANMSALPTSGTPTTLTWAGQTSTTTTVPGGDAYFTGGGAYGTSSNVGGAAYLQGGPGLGSYTKSGPAYVDAGPVGSGPGVGNAVNIGTLSQTTAVKIGHGGGAVQVTLTGSIGFGAGSTLNDTAMPPFLFSDTPTVVTVTSGTTLTRNTSFIANNTSQVVLNPDYNQPVGSMVRVYGLGSGGWKIAQNVAGEQIVASGHATTAGTSGYVASGTANDSIVLVCVVLHSTWEVIGGTGTYTYN